jgi:hypothetical protein
VSGGVGRRMGELEAITERYTPEYVQEGLGSLEDVNRFALQFYKDVAEIFDCITRIKNIKRNPSGFSIDDAPILGLLVRIWKLLKEIIRYYEFDNAEIISLLERPMLESSVIATYLMTNNAEVMRDYRKCSYKTRLRILRDLKEGSPFFETKPGQRLLKSVQDKLGLENLTPDDFGDQKQNKWKLQGKSFYQIFSEVEHEDFYPSTYGMMSESIHGSWSESLDWCLTQQEDGTFKANPFSYPADVRFVTPVLGFAIKPYRLWLQRIGADDDNMTELADWIERMNRRLFAKFDESFDE